MKLFHRLSGRSLKEDTQEQCIPKPVYRLTPPFSGLEFASACLQKIIQDCCFHNVLDIGSGEGVHAEIFRNHGKSVTEVDFGKSCYFNDNPDERDIYFGNYLDLQFGRQFDLIWASHVLEHQLDVNQFLTKIRGDLREGGILAITVPPMKHEIVGGHVSLWNAGLLLYNLVMARFDCRSARILKYGYNISVIIEKHEIELPELSYDNGDIEKLLDYFPDGFSEPFDGDIQELNWI